MTERFNYGEYKVIEKLSLSGFLKELENIPVGDPDFEQKVRRLKEKYGV